jgi:hypothetical protein
VTVSTANQLRSGRMGWVLDDRWTHRALVGLGLREAASRSCCERVGLGFVRSWSRSAIAFVVWWRWGWLSALVVAKP